MTKRVQYIMTSPASEREQVLRSIFEAAGIPANEGLIARVREKPDGILRGDLTLDSEAQVEAFVTASMDRRGVMAAPKP